MANFALNWVCNECLTAKQGNNTYYKLEMNHRNGKSFSKPQYFLCYCFALNFSEKQLLYSFSLFLLLVILMLIFPSIFDLILKRLLEFKIKLNW